MDGLRQPKAPSLGALRFMHAVTEIRRAEGLSQAEMGKKLKCVQGYIGKIENGGVTSPGLQLVEKLCEKFDLSIEYFRAPGPANLSLEGFRGESRKDMLSTLRRIEQIVMPPAVEQTGTRRVHKPKKES